MFQEFSEIPKKFLKKKSEPSLFPRNSPKNQKITKIRQLSQKKLLFLLTAGFFLLICRHVPFRNADVDGLSSGLKHRHGQAPQKHRSTNSKQLFLIRFYEKTLFFCMFDRFVRRSIG